MTATDTATFSSVDAAELAGATYRQLDYWCRNGVLGPDHEKPLGSGARRRFTAEDVLVLRAIQRVSMALNELSRTRTRSGGARLGSTRLYREIADQVRAGQRHVVLKQLTPHVQLVVEIDDLSLDPNPAPVKPAPTSLETPA